MNTASDIRANIESLLREVHDQRILLAYHNILANLIEVSMEQNIVGYDRHGNPVNQNDYIQMIESVREEVKKGEFVPQEELEQEVENW